MPESPPVGDLQRLRQRLTADLVIARSDPASAPDPIAEWLATQAADGSWPDVRYDDAVRGAWRTAAHLDRLWRLAQATFTTPDAGILARIGRGLACWFRLDPRNSNWWWNEIGVPTYLGNILLVLGAAAEPTWRAQGCAIMRRSNHAKWTGQNLVWGVNVQIVRGCLEDDAKAVAAGFNRLFGEIIIAPPGTEGVQADFSFHQHGSVLYSGGYGQGFSIDGARLIACAHGTRFQAPETIIGIIGSYLLDGQRWMLRGGTWDFGVVGREFCRAGKTARPLAQAARLMAGLGLPRQDEFARLADSIAGDRPDPAFAGNRHFWRSDYMAHQRPGFAASARMHSRRLFNTDALINDENRRSHFIADGAFCLMRDGGEYTGIFPVWDWQRIPGITCEQRPAMPDPKLVRRTGPTAFVGGVSDGSCGLAAMQHRRDKLTAHKAWFFLDDAVVCLGAGITCASQLPVLTSLNQCLRRGPVERAPAWVWHDQVGYALLAPGDLLLTDGPQRGRWSDIGGGATTEVELPVFSLALAHGRRPRDAAYAYAVLPGLDTAALPAWCRQPPVRVLANTPSLQAVHHPASGLTGAVFHRPGRLDGAITLAVNRPCLVLMRREADGVSLSVANPANKALTVLVDLGLVLEGAKPTAEGSRVRFDLPGGAEAGRSVTQRFVIPPGR